MRIRQKVKGALLAMAVGIMAGCASVGTDGPVPVPVVEEPPAPQGPSVVRFEDGREGFSIRETPSLDETSRRDFEEAVAMLNAAQYDPAIALLEKVVARDPGVTAPHIDLAIAYRLIGRPEQAEVQLQAALDLVPDHPVACNLSGLLYRESGRFSEAREIYQRALVRFPDYYPIHRNLGILCDLYLDDPACALAHYDIYSRARPEDRQVEIWIVDLRNRMEGQ